MSHRGRFKIATADFLSERRSASLREVQHSPLTAIRVVGFNVVPAGAPPRFDQLTFGLGRSAGIETEAARLVCKNGREEGPAGDLLNWLRS